MRGALKELQSLLRILRFNSRCRRSDANDGETLFRRMLAPFSVTSCGIFDGVLDSIHAPKRE